MGAKKEHPQPEPAPAGPPRPFHAYVNLGKLDYVTRAAGGDVIVVGRWGAREICVTIRGEDLPELVARLGRPMAKKGRAKAKEPRQMRLAIPAGEDD